MLPPGCGVASGACSEAAGAGAVALEDGCVPSFVVTGTEAGRCRCLRPWVDMLPMWNTCEKRGKTGGEEVERAEKLEEEEECQRCARAVRVMMASRVEAHSAQVDGRAR